MIADIQSKELQLEAVSRFNERGVNRAILFAEKGTTGTLVLLLAALCIDKTKSNT